ncbi:MAG: hypothetical protein IT428_22810 [Planctomycetaceae bacterium]|nr:hypothetical protein [Planctomycetaceae bacterium]
MPASKPVEVLFSQLAILLKRHRFKRESDESGFKLFTRKCRDWVERIGILTKTSGNGNGGFTLSVVMGIEFTNLERERLWIGMPRTHGSVEMRLLNKAAKKEYVCTEDSDVKGLTTQLVDLIVEAGEELKRRSEKLRKAYLSLVEARGSNTKKRLAIFAERKAKELKKRVSSVKKTANLAAKASVNAFEIAAALLRTKRDQMLELQIHEFDDADAHDRRRTQQIQQQFVDNAMAIQNELSGILDAPHETGTVEHKKLPINGVCYFAYWYVGWKILYVVVSHEDVGLPCCLLMGSVTRNCP